MVSGSVCVCRLCDVEKEEREGEWKRNREREGGRKARSVGERKRNRVGVMRERGGILHPSVKQCLGGKSAGEEGFVAGI